MATTDLDAELTANAEQLVRILYEEAPKRDDDAKPHVIRSHGIIISPFPGNLKVNGSVIVLTGDGLEVRHGYEPARYALFANKTSRRPNYIEKSINKFRSFLLGEGWEEE